MSESIVIVRHAALDESDLRGGSIILRGVLDATTLRHLLIDEYQREAAPLTSMTKLANAIKQGEVLPDIELGMRGQKFTSRTDSYWLHDPVYIIDGLQRVSAALYLLSLNPQTSIRIGATVHFDTTKEWESERFRVLNTLRSPVSPNVLLRNDRERSPALLTLYGLAKNDDVFPLRNRVSWTQRMQRGELITALTLAKTVIFLHSHKAGHGGARVREIVSTLDRGADKFGLANLRANIVAFYNLVDECWGIKHVQYRETASHLRGTFLSVLAKILSDHFDFWQGDDKRLVINADLRRKIKGFSLSDPEVARLCGSGGRAREILYIMLRDHINSGKRAKRLRPRDASKYAVSVNSMPECEEEAA